MEEEKLQGGCARGRSGKTRAAVAAGAGQWRKALLGEGSLMLPPHLLSISNSLLVPFSATVSFAADSLSLPSFLPAGSPWRWHEQVEPGGARLPSPLAAGKVPSSLGAARGPCATAVLPGA